jgi:hypothetical protein
MGWELGMLRGMWLAAALLMTAVFMAPTPAEAATCSNEALRTGPSAGLPDCRAYELVSPPDMDGRLLWPVSSFGFETLFDLFPTELASPTSDSIVFETYNGPPLSPPEPNGNFDVYEARRTEAGWQSVRRISPSGPQKSGPTSGGVSSDHAYAFTHVNVVEGGIHPSGSLATGFGVDYLSNPDGSFEPVGKGSLGEEPLAQGRYISRGGEHVIFSTGAQVGQSIWCKTVIDAGRECKVLELQPEATTGVGAIYDREADGVTHLVSLLPGATEQTAGQQAFYQGASSDGASIAFKINGALYVRVHSGGPGEETEEVAPAGDTPTFAGLSQEGKYLFYVSGGEQGTIHRFETGTDQDLEVNPGNEGEIVNVSADGSHVYFVSNEEIGGEGGSGEPNLFAWNGSTTQLVATVAPSDLVQTSGSLPGIPALTNWTDYAVAPVNQIETGPGADSSRSTPDGDVLVFESKAKLDPSYENSGHTEIYRWEEGGAGVDCVSCNSDPLAGAASADARLQALDHTGSAMIVHNLSDDGSRVFFETKEAISPADTGGTNDVYEWHQEGSGSRMDLISSGQSVQYPLLVPSSNLPDEPNLLFAITPDGGNVVFLSQDDLTGEAGSGGVPAIYDARVNGGFPPHRAPPVPCSEEGCRHATSTSIPSFALPQSEGEKGKGNVKPQKRRCQRAKGNREAKVKRDKRCAKKHSKHRPARISAAEAAVPSAAMPSADAPAGVTAGAGSSQGSAAASPGIAASGEFSEFGINSVSAGLSTTAAGQHPDFTTFFKLNFHLNSGGQPEADARVNEVSVSLPPGLLGNPTAIPSCKTGEFIAFANCPKASQVGVTKVLINGQGRAFEPIYNLTPPHPDREIARLGFFAGVLPVYIDVKVRTASDYGVTARIHSAPALRAVLEAETTLWGDPTNPIHDPQRLTAKEAPECSTQEFACEAPEGKREVPRTDLAFMTNPAECEQGDVGLSVTSYQLPGRIFSASAPLPAITGCQGLPFAPGFSAAPTTLAAGAPTGLSTKLVLPQHLGAGEPATATMREARVTLPGGMQVNPAAANWIEACSAAQVGFHSEVDANCPDGSKLGTATIRSPALSQPIAGNLYQRTPEPGHQLGLWLAVDALGLHVKLPGELEPDKQTGRLTAVFRDLPQVPVEEIDLDVWGGARAPLIAPQGCGTYVTDYVFTPHGGGAPVSGSSPMQVTGACNRPFDPKLKAGTTRPVAGKFSPLVVDLERPDGNQALRGFRLKLPDGLLARIKGVGRCTDAEATAGACPASSKLGTVAASAGPGPDPLWVPQPGKAQPGVYLGGPYKDSPLSVVTLVPAQAGPFDLGTVVVRSGLGLDPDTNRPVIEADPLPRFFEGVGLDYRRLHVTVDRPGFTLNPTDCSVMAVNSDVASTQGTIAHPSTRFKVTGCRKLKFAPKLSLSLKGGTKRSDYPALTAVLKARRGDANIARARVSLPHSEFLAQEHIVTICTRKQFAADKCPKGSVYGHAEATTPLLARPLRGPVYLRSSDNPLPDMVAALHGELDVNLVGRIDSHDGGIRTTFASVPDAPVTRFVLRMKGGAKGLLVNSTNVCAHPGRAGADLTAQNGRVANLRPVLGFGGCGGK